MTHAEMDELYELFVLGALDRDEAAGIEQHLREDCTYCTARVREATVLAAAFAGLADTVQPPENLKKRVLNSIAPRRTPVVVPEQKKQSSWLGGMLALGAACVALTVFCLWLGGQTDTLQNRLTAAEHERDQLETALKSLSHSDTRTVQFGKANQPQGRLFINRGGGFVFTASRLPRLPQDRTFELWYVPSTGAPRSAGLFRSDANGDTVQVINTAITPATTNAVAVSVEPDGGSPAPTTTPIIVVPLG